jgi:putative tricarboxylic transport membrane protein
MGLVLGDLLEKNWSQAMIIFNSDWTLFFHSWIANLFFALTVLSLASPFLVPWARSRMRTAFGRTPQTSGD